jgi:hypothetical protein
MLQGKIVWEDVEAFSTLPEGGGVHTVSIYNDYWWITNAEGQIAFYTLYDQRKPQCNQNRSIAEAVAMTHPEAVNVIQIPHVFVPLNVRDY